MSLVIILYRHFRTCLVHPNRLVIVMFGLDPSVVIIKPERKRPLFSVILVPERKRGIDTGIQGKNKLLCFTWIFGSSPNMTEKEIDAALGMRMTADGSSSKAIKKALREARLF